MNTQESMYVYKSTAEFTAKVDRPCRLLTAECPNRCNHAKTSYDFQIVEIQHEKNIESNHTKWVIPVQAGERVSVSGDDMGEFRDVADELCAGDRVHMNWEHNYVVIEGGGGPKRPVKLLELI
jgi:hypothetical protein